MLNTDSAMFIPLYKFITENNIYIPKISNQKEGWYYIDIIETQLPNSDIELNYKNFIKGYNTKIKLLYINLDYEWIYYYIYIILYCDFGLSIDKKLYDEITKKVLNSDFVKQDKINVVKQIMLKCGNTPDFIYGWMEGSVISLINIIVTLDLEEEFNKIVTEIKNSTLESYRNIIPYLIDMLYDGSRNDKIYAEIYKKYFNKLNE
jgi:hypothetical protein